VILSILIRAFGTVIMLQQLMAEQQEEFISNTLLKKIQELKNEKEQLARNYEQEEEFLTNDLSRKLFQVNMSLHNSILLQLFDFKVWQVAKKVS